jgi:hypothetical protein
MLERKEIGPSRKDLALVTIGALLGVETIRGHGEHLVALNANAVQHAVGAARRGGVASWLRRSLGRFAHGTILAQAA